MMFAADELPKKDPGESLDTEPQLILGEVPDGPMPSQAMEPIVEGPGLDRLIAQLERAKKNAAWSERLFKSGVLAKVEAEKRALQVPRLNKEVEEARLRIVTGEFEAERKRFEAGEAGKEELEKAEARFHAATASAVEAAAKWQSSQVEAAELNLHRQRRLVAYGIASAAAVRKAQQQLAALKGEVVPATPAPVTKRRPLPASKRR